MAAKSWGVAMPTVVRLVFLCFFLYTTVSISLSCMSLVTLLLFLGSIYLLDEPKTSTATPVSTRNPLKGKPQTSGLNEEREKQVAHAVSDFVSYDAENCRVLDKFGVIRMGSQFGADPHVFGRGVRRVLQTLSDLDPAGVRCMDKSYVSKRGWVFEFNRVTMFITTFAPCYPPSNSRYAFGADDCFILFQPELSFAQHDLPDDTPVTNWDNPVTVRDRIRTAFRAAGRSYNIRETILYPMAHDIVKPLFDDDPLVEWWLKE
ncbi:hypothetical protein BaRGS_00031965 [Batillaria attramentaria]|uniref:Uncharacterized protein n=1 Tax=Batillaria attramentaria TaxID=370345 RepID=A0ABD0JPK0_9CAEN